jgi:hypothetical protein
MFDTVVVDDLLNYKDQGHLHDMIMHNCEFKFLNDVSGNNDQPFPSHGFVHVINHPEKEITHNTDIRFVIHNMFKYRFDQFVPGYKKIYYNRIFLQLPLAPQFRKVHNGVHVDLPSHLPHVACVYYVNDSDGDTIIYEQTINDVPGGSQNVQLTEHKRVTPRRGRAVFFDGSRYHCSSQPSVNYRTIINFDLTV